ncbi:hypothetical protein AMYBAR_005266 [Amycolatopsis bartoniae]|nr:hypothetical protein [Amycolatopsis bartoniae]TVT11307.1 hypothetical protein FNH07_02620 [Amycolatopsis bartoniae]
MLPAVRGSLWGFDPDRTDEDGAELREYLLGEAVPRWKSFLDQRRLAAAFSAAFDPRVQKSILDGSHAESDIRFLGKIRGCDEYLGKIILGVDEGDPEELESLIDWYVEHGRERGLLEWLRARLRARAAGHVGAESGGGAGE